MNTTRVKALFVDDEQANLTAYKRNYRRDLEVFQAISAEEAFSILEKETIDVIVSDQRMPNITGVEFLANVKEKSPATMRILVTGYSDIEAVIAAINKAGVFNYLTKPYTPEELLSQIKQAHAICETKRAIERLTLQHKELFEQNQDPCFVLDKNQQITEINPAALRFFAVDENTIKQQGLPAISENARELWALLQNNAAQEELRSFQVELVGGLSRKFTATLRTTAIKTPGVIESSYTVQVLLPREDILSSVRAA